ncbi:hypothetical protein C1X91_35275, partial [Pseudomonas sp. GP01-A5]
GYWHARSLDYTSGSFARQFEWMRLPGDLVFIFFGAVPLTIAACKAYWSVAATRADPDRTLVRNAAPETQATRR